MENSQLVLTQSQIDKAKHPRDAEGRTLHGVPRSRKGLQGLVKRAIVENSLCKGHLSEAHVKQHEQADDAKHVSPSDRINTAVKSYQEKTGIHINYEVNRQPTRLEKSDEASNRTFQRQFNTGSGRLYSLKMRNSPWARRMRNGMLKLKQIRPVKIMLARISENNFAKNQAKGKKNTKGVNPVYHRVNRVTQTRATKTQVVHPSW